MENQVAISQMGQDGIELREKELNLECLRLAERNYTALECDMLKLAAFYVNFLYNGQAPESGK